MSNKVYFSSSLSAKRPLWYLVRSISKVLYYALPGWSSRQTANLLLIPKGKVWKLTETPKAFSIYRLKTREGQLQCYEVGDGPTVLLTHGWAGGAYQFFSLMQKLASAGYKAVAFDHPGHGCSDGRYSSAPQFVRAFQDVLEALIHERSETIVGIVSHSLGSIAVVNQKPEVIKGLKLCLIAPAFRIKENMQSRIHDFGLYPKLFNNILSRLHQEFGVSIDELELDLQLPKFSAKTLILHDRNDRFAKVQYSEDFHDKFPESSLVLTEGLGHGRILQSECTWDSIRKHLESPLSLYSEVSGFAFSH